MLEGHIPTWLPFYCVVEWVLCTVYSDADFCAQSSGDSQDISIAMITEASLLCIECFPIISDWLIQSIQKGKTEEEKR